MADLTPRPAPHTHDERPSRAHAVGLAVASVLLLGACTAAPLPVDPMPTATASEVTTDCPQSGVRISSPGGDAAMGLRALSLELVNCGTEPYPLNGYPAPRLLDGDGNPIPVTVIEGATGITSGFDAPPRPLALRPGERAGATVLWRNLVTDPSVVATNGERLEIAPAAGQPVQIVGLDKPIDLGNTRRLGVSAWQKLTP